MTAKEVFLELLKPDGKPARQLKQYEAFQFIFSEPTGPYMMGGLRPDGKL